MSIRTCAARVFSVSIAIGVVTTGLVDAQENTGERRLASSDGHVGRAEPTPFLAHETGLVLKPFSFSDLRTWRAIEEVVNATDPSGQPRSPTLRRLWDWAEASGHVVRVEMVDPSQVETGIAGRFRIERVDPNGRRHVALIRLCLENIRHAVESPRPGGDGSFVRFQGLSREERYVEVLAHELAHAEYSLDDVELLAQLEAARLAREELFAGTERVIARLPMGLQERLREGQEVLSETEAYADSVEARVLNELAGEPK